MITVKFITISMVFQMSKMKQLEELFYFTNPLGFESAEMIEVGKKHKLDKLSKQAKDNFSKEAFETIDILESFRKIVNQSTLVSRFEKPTFKTFMNTISDEERELLKTGLYENLHGNEQLGFEMMVSVMMPYKTAKWPILTVLRAYYNLQYDIFIKPTTVKMILKYFEADFKYTSKPSYEFYERYRTFLNEIKETASDGVKTNNPAFSGFLMMTIEG